MGATSGAKTPLPGRKPARRNVPPWLFALVLVVWTLLAWSGSLRGAYILDDLRYFSPADQSTSFAEALRAAATSGRPIVEVSFVLNAAILDRAADGRPKPLGLHVVNLVIHCAAGLVLFGLIRRSISFAQFEACRGNRATVFAFAAALLWLVHPLQTGSVTYIAQRAESMMGLFYLLTLYLFVRAIECPARSHWWLGASVFACALGMGSKAVMVTAPLMVLLYDWVIVRSSAKEIIRERTGYYIALCATWIVLVSTGVAQGVLGLKGGSGPATVGFSYDGVTWLEYALTQPQVVLHYLKLAIWPTGQCLDYMWPIETDPLVIALSAGAVLGLVAVSLFGVWRRMWMGFAGAWFFIILAPTSSFIPIKDLAFEHRMYLPLAAIAVLGAWIWHRISMWAVSLRSDLKLTRIMVPVTTLLAAAVALSMATHLRNRLYQDPVAMWFDVLKVCPDSARAHAHLGSLYEISGDHSEALVRYQLAGSVDPSFAVAHYNSGRLLSQQGKKSEAAEAYRAAIEADPNFVRAHIMLSNLLLERGQEAESEALLRKAIVVPRGRAGRSNLASAHFNLANSLARTRRVEESLFHYETAIEFEPDHSGAHAGMGLALARLGKAEQAEQFLRRALELDPTNGPARRALDVLSSSRSK